MTPIEIMRMQEHLNDAGFKLEVDGFWGPLSQQSCRSYLRGLMPFPNPWPLPDYESLVRFYGQPGDERNLVVMPFPYEIKYDGKIVTKTRVHKKCADSLYRILEKIRKRMEAVPDIVDEATDYGGVYNNRAKRGSTSKSLHAWGAAIDLDADDNSFRDSWPMKADMPLEIMEEFAREGWLSAGAFWGYDAMHFQATR